MRTCIGCRARFARETLVRLVCDAEGAVHVDRHLKAPGRGAHLCYDARCAAQAIERRAFGRAFRRQVAPVELEALMAAVEAAIEARVVAALRVGRGPGWTASGADVLDRSADALELLVVAHDAAEGTVARLQRLAERAECPLRRFGDRAALGATQDRDLLAAVGVVDAKAAGRLENEFKRRDLLGLRREVKSQ